ncbi:MAG: GntR family transcriptional regulator [Proteobacteria bacterium]|jgi:DNA-binding GntR family transcriptional regulator|nr:GntR family transcriptional regulator [Pseudomonadota bacterium]
MQKGRNIASETTLVDRARAELEVRFITLQIPPGSVWSEGSLSEMLGIGRTPVREAVASMAQDGLVTVIRRAGIVVSEISLEDQMAVVDTRRVLEKLVSLRAARRCTRPERDMLLQMADGIQAAGEARDVHAYLDNHFKIKRFVAQCARNKFAERALRPLHTLSQRFYFAHHVSFNNLPVVGMAHAQLTRAIVDCDEPLVASRCDAVSDIADQFTRDLLGRQS